MDLQAELNRNLELWDRLRPSSFKYVIQQSCFCLFGPSYGPNEVFINQGEVSKIVYRGVSRNGYRSGDSLLKVKGAADSTPAELFDSIRMILHRIEKWQSQKDDYHDVLFEVDYNETYGFPTRIAYDDPYADDEEWSVAIEDFQSGPFRN